MSDLKIVRSPGEAGEPAAEAVAPATATDVAGPGPSQPGGDADDEIFSRLERLADLCSREIITAEEFAAKKAELLARL